MTHCWLRPLLGMPGCPLLLGLTKGHCHTARGLQASTRWMRLLPSLERSHPGSRFSAGRGAAGAGGGQCGLRSAGLLHCLGTAR
eukprot:6394729-Amphidinium_carterae.1